MGIFQYLLILLTGCGIFIAGMNMLSGGLEKTTGPGLKRLMGKISDNRFVGVGIGLSVTAFVQSSSATTVMTIGFVNAGVMNLFQATSIIMGSNIGTTITGLIVSLSAFDVTLYASFLTFIGVVMMFFKKEIVKNIGSVLCGLGLLFVGLETMGGAFDNAEIKNFFEKLFASIDFPLFLILLGMLFTALLQSSSAMTGLIIIMVGKGALSVSNALFIVLGSNIGTCVTALLASIGTETNAKRTAFIHLLFNVIGTVVFTIVLLPLSDSVSKMLEAVFHNPQMEIAGFHLLFNTTTTLLLLPFVKPLVRLSTIVVKDKKKSEEKFHLRFIDHRLLSTPAVALMQVKREVEFMAGLAQTNLEKSISELIEQKNLYGKEIVNTEEEVDFINNQLTKFLIELSPLMDQHQEKEVGSYFHVVNDIERIGDHALNFFELSQRMKKEELIFSEDAMEELKEMYGKIQSMFLIALGVFDDGNEQHLTELNHLEDEVDELKNYLTSRHYMRLSMGNCRMELSAYFYSLVSGLERIGDHLVNIGYSIVNPTGSQNQTKLSDSSEK